MGGSPGVTFIESLLLGYRTPGMHPPYLPPPMAGNFPTKKDKDELRGRPSQCWDNEALCSQNQSRGRKAKGRWGPSCLPPGKYCLPGPHPDPLPSRVQGDPGQNPAWPTQGGIHWVHQADNASSSMVPLCGGVLPQDGRKEPSLSPVSCWADIRAPELPPRPHIWGSARTRADR